MELNRSMGSRIGILRPGVAVLAVGAVFVGFSGQASAQFRPTTEQARSEAERLLQQSKSTLAKKEQRAKQLEKDLRTAAVEQSEITAQLIEAGKLAQESERRLTDIEARLGELDAQEKLIRGSLAHRHAQLTKLFSAMQRMGRNPPPVIITEREDALRMVRSAMLLARAFPELKSQADDLSARLKELTRVSTAIRVEGERLKQETAKLTETRTKLAALVESKKRSVAERERELEDVRTAAANLSRSVSDLGDLFGRLDKAVAERTALGEYERELRQREALEREAKERSDKDRSSVASAEAAGKDGVAGEPAKAADAAEPAGPKVAANTSSPTQPLRPSLEASPTDAGTKVALAGPKPSMPQFRLEPNGTEARNPGRMKPAVPFHLAKGRLPLPVQGRKLLAFGDKNQFGRVSKGMVIETRPAAVVTAPCDGWIVYAGQFRSYGQVLIINAGGGYHVLLANLSRIDVGVGRFVLTSEPIGAMTSNAGRSQDNAPVLYVEFRNKEGQSIDPGPWWAMGSQKVQG
jgi:septal ring factor EnvC (AmiA/AmiB activator)